MWWLKVLFLFSHSFFFFLFNKQKSLHDAAISGNESAIKRLIQAGANVDIQDEVWFFYFICFSKERWINLNLFDISIIYFLSSTSIFFCFLGSKNTSTSWCIKRTWKMCWIIDSKWRKCWCSRQGVIFYLFFWKINQFKLFSFYFCSLFHLLFVFRMDGHLFVMLHQKDMKNVLNYWFKMVQIFIFKTWCDFFICFFLKDQSI